MTFLQSILLGIIEGLTEFLPVSSTGHLIIASTFMGISEDAFVKNFEVIIQFGAILAVLVAYFQRFRWNWQFYQKIILAFLPTAAIGFILKSHVDVWLGSVHIVAWSLIVGGVVLILCDRIFAAQQLGGKKIDELSNIECLKLGFYQALAMIPGVSRSGATLLGGLILGMNKKEAAEFSFFLAVPTIAAAALYKLLKAVRLGQLSLDTHTTLLNPEHPWVLLTLGSLVSFIVALLAIRFFINIVSKYGLKYFGFYRILVGIILLWIF